MSGSLFPQISLSKPTLVGTGHPALKQKESTKWMCRAIAYAEAGARQTTLLHLAVLNAIVIAAGKSELESVSFCAEHAAKVTIKVQGLIGLS